MEVKKHIVIIGLPGSGKGTQGKLLASVLNIPFVPFGDSVRELAKQEEGIGKEIRADWASTSGWHPLPDDLAIRSVRESLEGKSEWVLEGFPRNTRQAEAFTEEVGLVIVLTVSEETSFQRVVARGRMGDDVEKIQERLSVERERFAPLVAYCGKKWRVAEVDGSGAVEAVAAEIRRKVDGEATI